MNNLIVFVEGKHDVLFINNILLKYFNVSKNWIPITYQQKSKKLKLKMSIQLLIGYSKK